VTNEKADQKIETERCQGTSEQTLCFLQTKVMTQREQIVKTTVNPVGVGLWLSDALVSFQAQCIQGINRQSLNETVCMRARTFSMLKLLLFIPVHYWRYFQDIYQFQFPIILVLSEIRDI
jgi:hypothetical protein